MPGSFIDQRERSDKELKSKGRIESERQWRSERVFSLAKHCQGNGHPLGGVCESLLFPGGQGQSLLEPNKGTLVNSLAEMQGPPGNSLNMVIITEAMKSKSKKQSPT